MMRALLLLSLLSPSVRSSQPTRAYSEQCVRKYAAQYRIEPELIAAFIDVESSWNPRAVSPKGAMGLMQLIPETAARFGAFDPFNPDQNIAAGTRYVTTLMWEFHGDLRLVAAAYNAPERSVKLRLLNYSNPEVVAYVKAVRARYVLRHTAVLNSRGGKR